jgi:hypothetical protein
MATETKSSSGGGCVGTFMGVFAGLGIFAFLIVGCVAAVCIGVIALAIAGQDATDKVAQEANNGMGAQDNPIPFGEWVQFDGAKIRVTEVVRPATAQVQAANSFNDDAPAGAEYVSINAEILCESAKCTGVEGKFWIVDDTGKEWGEAFVVNRDDIDSDEAVNGATMQGWSTFEFPVSSELKFLKVGWGSASLFVQPPAGE